MSVSLSLPKNKPFTYRRDAASWVVLFALIAALSATALRFLWQAWREDPGLSHGPLLLLIAVGLLWMRRKHLRQWEAAAPAGMVLLLLAGAVHVVAVWADIAFMRPISFFAVIAGGVWFLGGKQAVKACTGPLGLLAFAVPWPTTLVSSISFPLQLMSSAYAALFAGMFGLFIRREGVYLSVMPEIGSKPIYSIMVAQACSGLTSLMVLLAFGYLIAYYTPVRWWARVALFASVVPLTLFANAVRLTIILLVGGFYSAKLAGIVHDNEQPFLIFLCSFGLLGARQVLLTWVGSSLKPSVGAFVGSSDELILPSLPHVARGG